MSIIPLENDPALLYKWSQDVGKFIVGEEKNRIILILVCVTSRNSRPLHLMVMGESSAGKSHIVNAVIKYFEGDHKDPRDPTISYGPRVIKVQRITSAALNRLQKNLNGKILVVEELAGADAAQPQIRVMMSEGNLRLLTSVYDDKGKIMEKSKEIVTEGIPVFITTSTATTLETETNTRIFITSMDETEEQTRRVINFQAEEHQKLNIPKSSELNPDFKDLVSVLYPVEKVLIPYSHLLAKVFPSAILKARRDFPKLLNMVEVMAFLHQHQRPRIETPWGDYIVALPIDFFLAWRVIDDALRETVTMISKRLQRVMTFFTEDQHWTVQQVASLVGLSATRTHELLKELSNQSFLLREDQNRPYIYYRNPDKSAEIFSMREIEDEMNRLGESETEMFVDDTIRHSMEDGGLAQTLNITNNICILRLMRDGVVAANDVSEAALLSNIRIGIERNRFHINHWIYETRYVDPITGEGYYVGSPEFLLYYQSVCESLPTKQEPNSFKLVEDERDSIQESAVIMKPDEVLLSILEEGEKPLKQLGEVIDQMKTQGVVNPEGVIKKMVDKGDVYRPTDYTLQLTHVTLRGLREPGHI